MKIKIFFYAMALIFILSGCKDFQLIEKADNYKPDHHTFKKIVILEPDYFIADKSEDDVFKNEGSIKLQKRLEYSFKRAAQKFHIESILPGIEDSANAVFFNDIEKLRKEVTGSGFIYNFENLDVKINFPNIEPLAANLILSPEFQNLQKKYGTPYFIHTTVIQYKKSLFFLSVLADVAKGKIVYRELVKINAKPKGSILDLVAFNNFNDMLNQK
jgi:hypothetical protein